MSQNFISAMVLCRDGNAGTFKVWINERGELVSTTPDWRPECPSDSPTEKVGVLPTIEGRAGIGHVIDGDVWRDLEANGRLDDVWRSVLDGESVLEAVESVLDGSRCAM
ncbi:hypothetical protein I5M83_22060 [Pseudomonas aeruginosa]|nr:hypothetical protein [Pseudomonas aeruginosa]